IPTVIFSGTISMSLGWHIEGLSAWQRLLVVSISVVAGFRICWQPREQDRGKQAKRVMSYCISGLNCQMKNEKQGTLPPASLSLSRSPYTKIKINADCEISCLA